jgi:hypothetical protein
MSTLSSGWHHLVAVGSGSTTAFYIDGEYKGSAAFKSVKDVYSIGNYQGGSQQFGTIDDTRVYTRALTSTEIANHYNNQERLDYGDIRFISSDGATALNHWMEKDGTFWVKAPSLTNGDNTIYMYYGNAAVSSASNGDNVFDFFDDFSGTTINTTKWSETDSAGYITQNGQLIISNGQATWGTTEMHTNATFNRSGSFIVQGNYRTTLEQGDANKDTTMLWIKDSGTGTSYTDFIYALYAYNNNDLSYWQMREDGTARDIVDSLAANVQYKIRQVVKTAVGSLNQISTDNGNTWTTLYDSSYSTESSFKVGFTHYQGGYVYIDDIMVRKYAATEPTIVIASEETNLVSPASCSATKGINGVCGSANTTTVSSTPVNPNLCAVDGGTATDVLTTLPTTYTWTCEGVGTEHTDANCYANKSGVRVNGVCGSSNYTIVSAEPAENLCVAGGQSTVTTNSTTYTWTCDGISGGLSDACVANISGEVTNGTCGSSDGQKFTSIPITNLCLTGVPTEVSGTGPWTWTCNGVGTGATNQSCSSSKALPSWKEASPY